MAPGDAPVDIDAPVAKALGLGIVTSTALLIFGLTLLILRPEAPADAVRPAALLRGLGRWHPSAWLSLGILAMILTPALQVLTAAVSFARIRDWKYAWISAIVLAEVITGYLIGRS